MNEITENATLMYKNIMTWRQLIKRVAKSHQLTLQEWIILNHIYTAKNKSIEQHILAEELLMFNTEVNLVVTKLEKKKIIKKTTKAQNKRIRILTIHKNKLSWVKALIDLDQQIKKGWAIYLQENEIKELNLLLEKAYNGIETVYTKFV